MTPTTLLEREPAQVSGAGLSALVAAIFGLLQLYGVAVVDGTAEYVVAILFVATPYLTGLLIRFKVWSPASKDKAVEEARAKGRVAGVASEVAKRSQAGVYS